MGLAVNKNRRVILKGVTIELILLFPIFFLSLGNVAVGYAASIKIETKYTIMYFNTIPDMRKFSSSVDFPSKIKIGVLFSTPTDDRVRRHLVNKVDRLFRKAQAILGMRKRMPKVKVRVFSNKNQLQKKYFNLFKKKNNPRGWYIYRFNTVYLNVKDVHEGMLAHELGHAIIDNYLSVKPPRATAEILAKYVDIHLFDEVKKY